MSFAQQLAWHSAALRRALDAGAPPAALAAAVLAGGPALAQPLVALLVSAGTAAASAAHLRGAS